MSNRPADDYQYDIFLSYSRKFANDWVREHFLKLFRLYLEGGLGYSPSVFVDTEIADGDTWPLRLREALAQSRCLVAVLH